MLPPCQILYFHVYSQDLYPGGLCKCSKNLYSSSLPCFSQYLDTFQSMVSMLNFIVVVDIIISSLKFTPVPKFRQTEVKTIPFQAVHNSASFDFFFVFELSLTSSAYNKRANALVKNLRHVLIRCVRKRMRSFLPFTLGWPGLKFTETFTFFHALAFWIFQRNQPYLELPVLNKLSANVRCLGKNWELER